MTATLAYGQSCRPIGKWSGSNTNPIWCGERNCRWHQRCQSKPAALHCHKSGYLEHCAATLFCAIRAKDAIFGFPIGTGVSLRYPDGHAVLLALGTDNEVYVDALARVCIRFRSRVPVAWRRETPLALSRNQDVELKVLSTLRSVWGLASASSLPSACSSTGDRNCWACPDPYFVDYAESADRFLNFSRGYPATWDLGMPSSGNHRTRLVRRLSLTL